MLNPRCGGVGAKYGAAVVSGFVEQRRRPRLWDERAVQREHAVGDHRRGAVTKKRRAFAPHAAPREMKTIDAGVVATDGDALGFLTVEDRGVRINVAGAARRSEAAVKIDAWLEGEGRLRVATGGEEQRRAGARGGRDGFERAWQRCPRFGARTIAREIVTLSGIDVGHGSVAGEIDDGRLRTDLAGQSGAKGESAADEQGCGKDEHAESAVESFHGCRVETEPPSTRMGSTTILVGTRSSG